MTAHPQFVLRLLLLACIGLPLVGCGGGGEEKSGKDEKQAEADAKKPAKKFQAISLNPGGDKPADKPAEKTFTTEDVRRALNPLQIMVGSWRATLGKAKSFDALDWAWDFSNRKQPALVFSTMKGDVVKSGRLTYLPADETFEFEAVDEEGRKRTLAGKFSQDPRKAPGDDNRMHITYKLLLTEATPPEKAKPWQVVFNQQDNNRLLVEMDELRGKNFYRFETIAVQREGTSFAKSFDDYGERTCIVSQGLGTDAISYMGKTYYVCCSGCRAAFEDDPEYWIAKAKEREAEK